MNGLKLQKGALYNFKSHQSEVKVLARIFVLPVGGLLSTSCPPASSSHLWPSFYTPLARVHITVIAA